MRKVSLEADILFDNVAVDSFCARGTGEIETPWSNQENMRDLFSSARISDCFLNNFPGRLQETTLEEDDWDEAKNRYISDATYVGHDIRDYPDRYPPDKEREVEWACAGEFYKD